MVRDIKTRRRDLKAALILGNAGVFIWVLNSLSISRTQSVGHNIALSVILIIAAAAFGVFFSTQTRIGRESQELLPEIPVLIAPIYTWFVLVSIFHVLASAGTGRSISIAILIIVTLLVYGTAAIPAASRRLQTLGFHEKAVRTIVLLILSSLFISFALISIFQ